MGLLANGLKSSPTSNQPAPSSSAPTKLSQNPLKQTQAIPNPSQPNPAPTVNVQTNPNRQSQVLIVTTQPQQTISQQTISQQTISQQTISQQNQQSNNNNNNNNVVGNEEQDIFIESYSTALKNNMEYLCEILEVDMNTLQVALLKFCTTRQLLISQYELLADKQSLIGKFATYLSKIATNYLVPTALPLSQLVQIKRVAFQLYIACSWFYKRDISNLKESNSNFRTSSHQLIELQDIYSSILFALLQFAWSEKKYSAMHVILTPNKRFIEIWNALHDDNADNPSNNEAINEQSTQQQQDEKIFLEKLLLLLIFYKFSLVQNNKKSNFWRTIQI